LALQPDTAMIFAIEQLSFILEKEKVKTIIRVEFKEKDVMQRLKEITSLQKRVMFIIKS
jgi:hypothetical protein